MRLLYDPYRCCNEQDTMTGTDKGTDQMNKIKNEAFTSRRRTVSFGDFCCFCSFRTGLKMLVQGEQRTSLHDCSSFRLLHVLRDLLLVVQLGLDLKRGQEHVNFQACTKHRPLTHLCQEPALLSIGIMAVSSARRGVRGLRLPGGAAWPADPWFRDQPRQIPP